MENKFQTENVLTISVSHMFHDIYTAILAPMLPLLIEKLDISLSLSALMEIVLRLPSLINPFIGLIADKIAIRYFVILSPGITAISMSLLGIAPNYWIILLLLFLTGISSALFHVPSPVLIRHTSGDRIGLGMSFYMLGGEIARTLGPFMITAAMFWWHLEGSYRLMPLGIITSVILYFKLNNNPLLKNFESNKKELGAKDTFISLIPFFILISGICFFRAVMKSALTLYLPTFLTNHGYSLWIAGISLSILQFSGAIGTMLAGYISDKIGRKNTLLIAGIANPIMMWLFINLYSVLMKPILILMGFFLFTSGPVLLALVQDTDSNHPSFINGIYMTINFSISSLVVLMIGLAGDKFGLDQTYKICSLLTSGTIPFILLLPKKKL